MDHFSNSQQKLGCKGRVAWAFSNFLISLEIVLILKVKIQHLVR